MPPNQKVNKADEQTYLYIGIRLGSGHRDIQHNNPQHKIKKVAPSEQYYAECHNLAIMPNVINLYVVMLIVVAQSSMWKCLTARNTLARDNQLKGGETVRLTSLH
jgi:hypothetical protein